MFFRSNEEMDMTKLIVRIGIIIFLFAGNSIVTSAQRTADRSVHLGITQKVSCYSIPSGGLEVNAGQYLLNSYWTAGVSAVDWNQRIGSQGGHLPDAHFDHVMWTVNGGWMYRLWGAYSRWLNIYIGGKAFIGGNQYEVFSNLPDEAYYDLPKVEFIYGIEPCLDVEFYISKWIALTIGVQMPLTFSSSLPSDLFHLTGSLGIRFNL